MSFLFSLQVMYALYGNSAASEFFDINPTTGVVYVKAPLKGVNMFATLYR